MIALLTTVHDNRYAAALEGSSNPDPSLLEPSCDPELRPQNRGKIGPAPRVTPVQRPKRGLNIAPFPPLVDMLTTFHLVGGVFGFALLIKPRDVVQTDSHHDPVPVNRSRSRNVSERRLRAVNLTSTQNHGALRSESPRISWRRRLIKCFGRLESEELLSRN